MPATPIRRRHALCRLGLAPLLSACGGGNSGNGLAATPAAPDRYRYQQPAALGDGWRTGPLAEAGIETAALEALVDRIRGRQESGLRFIDGLLIARGGTLVLDLPLRSALDFTDAWAQNQNPALHAVHSVTKSFAATLIGLTLDDGAIASTELRVHERFADRQPIANWSAAKADTRLSDWLSMQHGLRWDELSSSYQDPANINARMIAAADPLGFLLGQAMDSAPGTRFAYSTGVSYALGLLVQRATGQSVAAFLRSRLLEPLGIDRHAGWSLAGALHMGSALYLSLRDMAKLGQLHLAGGVWQGRRLLSTDWVQRATHRHATPAGGLGYGYQWWLTEFSVAGRRLASFYAHGWGGQFVFVLPELSAVIALQGNAYDRADPLPDARRLLETELLPALR